MTRNTDPGTASAAGTRCPSNRSGPPSFRIPGSRRRAYRAARRSAACWRPAGSPRSRPAPGRPPPPPGSGIPSCPYLPGRRCVRKAPRTGNAASGKNHPDRRSVRSLPAGHTAIPPAPVSARFPENRGRRVPEYTGRSVPRRTRSFPGQPAPRLP